MTRLNGARILVSLFPRHAGTPKGVLPATVAADLDRYTTQVSEPNHTGQGCRTSASKVSESIAYEQIFVNSFDPEAQRDTFQMISTLEETKGEQPTWQLA